MKRKAAFAVLALLYVVLAYVLTGGRCDYPTSDLYRDNPQGWAPVDPTGEGYTLTEVRR